MFGSRLPAAAVIVLLLVLPAAAEDFPALTGRVVDVADIIPADEERRLGDLLEAHERETTNQVVVATLPSLGGRSIEETGVALGRHWQLGQKGKDNGVLLLVAPVERAVRIEVGYGLEGVLTDAVAKVIIESSILPRFREGDLSGGIGRGTEDIVSVLSGQAEAVVSSARRRGFWSGFRAIIPGLAIAAVIMATLLAIRLLNADLGSTGRGSRRSRRRYVDSTSGGFSGGGFSGGGGGFSGGGGSFGGGGSSGSW